MSTVWKPQLPKLWWMPNSVDKAFGLAMERAHQDICNDTPQPTCWFQGFLLAGPSNEYEGKQICLKPKLKGLHWNSLYEAVFNLFWLSLAFMHWLESFWAVFRAFGWLPGTLYTWYKIVCNFGEYLSFYIQMFLQHHQEHLQLWGLSN